MIRFAVLGLACLAWACYRQPAPVRTQLVQISSTDTDSEPAVAPDGKSVAFVSRRGGRPRIWVRSLVDGAERAITSGPDVSPRLSRDGRQVLFTRLGEPPSIHVQALNESVARRAVEHGFSADWSPDSASIVSVHQTHPAYGYWTVSITPAAGGATKKLVEFEAYRVDAPRWSPDGRRIALRRRTFDATDPMAITWIAADGGERGTVPCAPGGTDVSAFAWIDSRQLAYMQRTSPHAGRYVRHDLRSGASYILGFTPPPSGGFDILGTDSAVFDTGFPRQQLTAGNGTLFANAGSVDRHPSISPADHTILFASDREGKQQVWTIGRPLFEGSAPRFVNGGKQVLWTSSRSGRPEVWISAPDGSEARQVTNTGIAPEMFAAGGGTLFYQGPTAFMRVGLEGGAAEAIRPGLCGYVAASADGKLTACASGSKIRLSNGVEIPNATRPQWLRDGSIAFLEPFERGENAVFVQEPKPGAARRAMARFNLPPETFDVTPDGKLLLVSLSNPVSRIQRISVSSR